MNKRMKLQTKFRDRYAVSVANQQSRHRVDESQLTDAVRAVLGDSRFTSAAVSVAVVDDETIHDLNRRYLNHDWPTDVLSFVLDDGDGHLEGEVILSADTAARSAAEIGWTAGAEQLLYAIHGALHLVGFRDKSAFEQKEMRVAEAAILSQFGFRQPPRLRDDKTATTRARCTHGATAR
jgi:probable rRNA maturation factor